MCVYVCVCVCVCVCVSEQFRQRIGAISHYDVHVHALAINEIR